MIDTGRLKEIEKDISRIEKEKKASESKAEGFRERMKALEIKITDAQTRATALKEARQIALVNGDDAGALTTELKGIQSDLEIMNDECQGLQKVISSIESKYLEYEEQITKLKSEYANIKCVLLARKLNTELPKLADLINEYEDALSQTNQRCAGGLVTLGGNYEGYSPSLGHLVLPKLYIKDEFDCPEHLAGRPDMRGNYYLNKKL